jgi:hypothetical protein
VERNINFIWEKQRCYLCLCSHWSNWTGSAHVEVEPGWFSCFRLRLMVVHGIFLPHHVFYHIGLTCALLGLDYLSLSPAWRTHRTISAFWDFPSGIAPTCGDRKLIGGQMTYFLTRPYLDITCGFGCLHYIEATLATYKNINMTLPNYHRDRSTISSPRHKITMCKFEVFVSYYFYTCNHSLSVAL